MDTTGGRGIVQVALIECLKDVDDGYLGFNIWESGHCMLPLSVEHFAATQFFGFFEERGHGCCCSQGEGFDILIRGSPYPGVDGLCLPILTIFSWFNMQGFHAILTSAVVRVKKGLGLY